MRLWVMGLVLLAALAGWGAPRLCSQFSFEKIESGVVTDVHGVFRGETVGMLKTAPGHDGKSAALVFDGKGYVNIPAPAAIAFADGLTLELWIRPDALTAGRLLDRATAGAADSFCLDTHPGDAIRFITPQGQLSAPACLKTGQWLHVAAVYDAKRGKLAIYLNGKSAAVLRAARDGVIGGSNPIRIGADSTGGVGFRGLIDGARLYNYVLTAAQVAERFAGKEPTLPVLPRPETLPIAYKNGLQTDPAALVARNDVVYCRPAVYAHEGMPVGNGRLCAMVRNTDGIDIQLTHADNIAQQTSSGRLHISATPSLLGTVGDFTARQSLYDGTVQTRCAGDAGTWTSTVTVVPNSDVLAVRVAGKFVPGVKLSVWLENWRTSATLLKSEDGFTEELPAWNAPQFNRKMALVMRADCPMAPAPIPARAEPREIGLLLTPTVQANGATAFTVYVANPIVKPDENPATLAARELEIVLARGWDANRVASAARWHDFWSRSFVYLHSADGVGDYLENLWYLHLYWMGCMGEGVYPAKFNGGAFLEHDDSRSWGSSYWYQNTRELYWPLTTANHLELCAPFRYLYLSTLDASRKLAKDFYHKKGIQVEETLAINGSGDKAYTTSTMLYLTSGLEAALQMYDQAVYAHDDALLRRDVYPMLKEAVDFYLDYARKGDDGLYHIAPTTARETYQDVQDGMTDLCALRTALPLLLHDSARWSIDADRRAQWAEFLAHLAPLPLMPPNDAYAPCVIPPTPPVSDNPNIAAAYAKMLAYISTSYTKYCNSENVALDVVHPFGLVGLSSDPTERKLAEIAYANRPFKGGGGWDSSPIWAARLGLADAFVNAQLAHARSTQTSPQGFWYSPSITVFANNVPDCPYFDAPGVNATATNEALLQSYNEEIRVWPAAPAGWSGAFTLRAKTGFLVTSERSLGLTRYVALTSLFGDRCRLVNPWPGEMATVICGTTVVMKSDKPALEFPSKAGQHYLVQRVAAPVTGMAFAKLAPAACTGPKLLNCTGDEEDKPVPGAGQPMLGITAAGLTSPRAAAKLNEQWGKQRLAPILAGRPKLTGAVGSWMPSGGKELNPAPWLTDGIFGAETIGRRVGIGAYVLAFPQPVTVSLLLQSYDRTGARQDSRGTMWDAWPAKLIVETSPDGAAWTRAAGVDAKGNGFNDQLTGIAIAFPQPVTAQYFRVTAVDGHDKPVPELVCDELEAY